MNEAWIIQETLRRLADDAATFTDSPNDRDVRRINDGRDYLTPEEATAIVDATLEYVGQNGDDTEYTYISGHRKRLIKTLANTPKADRDGMSLVDVGCYGYAMYWAVTELGYTDVVGVELRPDVPEKVIERTITGPSGAKTFSVYNFDVSEPSWPLDRTFDTAIFLETLEHVGVDPSGVMDRLNRLITMGGTLIMSVPNAISYKVLRELRSGMPPWTYWFFQPDLSHEPRHSFEFTPLVFRSLILASGFEERSFHSLFAYSPPNQQVDIANAAQAAGIDTTHFGETMICRATKTHEGAPLRRPCILYDQREYYRIAAPLIEQEASRRLTNNGTNTAHGAATGSAHTPTSQPGTTQGTNESSHVAELELKVTTLRSQVEELLFTHEAALTNQQEAVRTADKARLATEAEASAAYERLRTEQARANDLEQESSTLRGQLNDLLFQADARASQEVELRGLIASANADAEQSNAEVQRLSQENHDLQAKVDELTFACDLYLQRVDNLQHCTRVVGTSIVRDVTGKAKRVAQRIPVVRTVARPAYNRLKLVIKSRG